jgi:hypothetical protein
MNRRDFLKIIGISPAATLIKTKQTTIEKLKPQYTSDVFYDNPEPDIENIDLNYPNRTKALIENNGKMEVVYIIKDERKNEIS